MAFPKRRDVLFPQVQRFVTRHLSGALRTLSVATHINSGAGPKNSPGTRVPLSGPVAVDFSTNPTTGLLFVSGSKTGWRK